MRLPIGGRTTCKCGTRRGPSALLSCLNAVSAASKGVRWLPVRLVRSLDPARMSAFRRLPITLRSVSQSIGSVFCRAASSAKASRAMVRWGCRVSQSPSAQSGNSESRRDSRSAVDASHDNLRSRVPWQMRQGRVPRAYSLTKLLPQAVKALAIGAASKRAALSLAGDFAGEGTELARTADRQAGEAEEGRESLLASAAAASAGRAPLGRTALPCSLIGRFVTDTARTCRLRLGVE